MKLTKTTITALTVPAGKDQVFFWCDDIQGFGVRCTANGAKSFIVQRSIQGRTRRFTLGQFGIMPIAKARTEALKTLAQMHAGEDPQVAKRKAQAQTETLRELMDDYLAHKTTKHGALRPLTKADIEKAVTVTFAAWADKPVVTITRDLCLKRFRELSKDAPTQANQAFRNLRALLNWCREKHATADGQYPVLSVNPVSQMFRQGGMAKWNVEKVRTTRIPRAKIGAVWLLLEECGNPETNITTTNTSADLTAFMLLTGSRIGEASQLTWSNTKLDGDLPTFHFPEGITKNHNAVTFPMSAPLHAILTRRYQRRQKGTDYVFPALRGKTGYLKDPRAMFEKITTACGVHLHPHAMRRTFEDIASFVGVDGDQRRQLLNHLASDVHGQSYANNPDPANLLPAVTAVANWILAEAATEKARQTELEVGGVALGAM